MRRIPDKIIVLCDGLGENRLNDGSLFTDDGEALCFNGNAADDMNHETFIVQREIPVEDYWDCCKTAYKPYDVFVVAALLLLHGLCQDIFRSLLTGISGTGNRCWTMSARHSLILS